MTAAPPPTTLYTEATDVMRGWRGPGTTLTKSVAEARYLPLYGVSSARARRGGPAGLSSARERDG